MPPGIDFVGAKAWGGTVGGQPGTHSAVKHPLEGPLLPSLHPGLPDRLPSSQVSSLGTQLEASEGLFNQMRVLLPGSQQAEATIEPRLPNDRAVSSKRHKGEKEIGERRRGSLFPNSHSAVSTVGSAESPLLLPPGFPDWLHH